MKINKSFVMPIIKKRKNMNKALQKTYVKILKKNNILRNARTLKKEKEKINYLKSNFLPN